MEFTISARRNKAIKIQNQNWATIDYSAIKKKKNNHHEINYRIFSQKNCRLESTNSEFS